MGELGDGVHLQSRAAADEEIAARELALGLSDRRREQLAEERDRRLQRSVADGAARNGRAVRELRRRELRRAAEAAGKALDVREGAVELERVAAGGAVEPVDVLGQHPGDSAASLELGDRVVPVVRPCPCKHVEPLPVEGPERLGLASPRLDVRELLEAAVAPQPVATAIVG